MKTKYVVRTNHFYLDTDFYRIGTATQIVGIFDDFSKAKEKRFNYLRRSIPYMLASEKILLDGRKSHYSLYMHQKYSSSAEQKPYGYKYKDEKYFSTLKTLDEVEIFDTLYPTRAVEILLTNGNYLVKPIINKNFVKNLSFELDKQILDEYPSSYIFLDKSYYVDEFDFYNNILSGTGKHKLFKYYKHSTLTNPTFFDAEEFSKLKQWKIIDIKNNIASISKEVNYEQLKMLFESSKIKLFDFEQIPFDDINKNQKGEYEEYLKSTSLIKLINPNDKMSNEEIAKYLSTTLSLSTGFIIDLIERIK